MSVRMEDAGLEEAAVTMARASRELRNVAAMVEELEAAVGFAIELAGNSCAEHMLDLQKLDPIRQKIVGVADFIAALGGPMPQAWRVDAVAAARCVLLADLGARLGDARGAGAKRGPVETTELF